MQSPIPFENKSSQPVRQRRGFLQRFKRWLLRGGSPKEVGSHIWKNVLDDDLTGRSAQLSYYFFLSLFPGLIFLSSMVGIILGSQSRLRNHVFDLFGAFLPPSAYTLVASTFTEILKTSTASKAALGIFFALWSATSGISALQDTLNGVYRLKETRPIWKTTLVAMTLTVVVSFLGLIAITTFFYGGSIVDFISNQVGLNRDLAFVWKLAQWPISMFVLSIAAAIIYHYAPDSKRSKFRWITPGSVISILGWMMVSGLFRAYLHFFNRYSVTYGSLGAVIILLLWFYFSGFMLLLGAEVNSAILQCQMETRTSPQAAPSVKPPANKLSTA